MNRAHGAHVAAVVVKGRAIGEARDRRIAQQGQRIVGPVGVVVEKQHLGSQSRFGEGRIEMVSQKDHLLVQLPLHARSVLRVQRFVLDGDCVDGDAFLLHFPNVLRQVQRICRVALLLEGAAPDVIVGLHPGRSRPRRTQYLDVRRNPEDLLQDRNHVLPVLSKVELR